MYILIHRYRYMYRCRRTQTNIHTHIHTDMHTCMPACIHAHMHTCIHAGFLAPRLVYCLHLGCSGPLLCSLGLFWALSGSAWVLVLSWALLGSSGPLLGSPGLPQGVNSRALPAWPRRGDMGPSPFAAISQLDLFIRGAHGHGSVSLAW